MSQLDSVDTVVAPQRLTKLLTDLTTGDKQFLIVMACVGAIATLIEGFTALLISFGLTYFFIMPRPYSRRWYACYEYVVQIYRRKVKRGIRWTRSAKKPIVPASVFPFRVDWVSHIGLPHSLRHQTDAIIITGSGSDVASRSIHAQSSFYQQVSDILLKISGTPDISVKLSFVFRKRPVNEEALSDIAVEYLRPEVFAALELVAQNPDMVEAPQDWVDQQVQEWRLKYSEGALPKNLDVRMKRAWKAARRYIQSRHVASNYGNEVTMAAVLTVRRGPRLIAAAKGKMLEDDEISRLDVVDLTNMVIENFENQGISDVQVLDRLTARHYIREAWDVTDILAYRTAGSNEQEPSFRPERVVEEHHSYCRLDDTYHATLRMTKFPASMLPNTARSLFNADADWVSVTMFGEALQGGKEYLWYAWLMNAVDSLREWAGLSEGVATEHRREKMLARQSEIVESDYAEYCNVAIGVAQTSLESLEEDIRSVKRGLSSGMRAERVTGSTRQLNWMFSATTGINFA